jgi:hypothetical protein
MAVTMKRRRSKKLKIELPDSILSIIFSKLGLKDLVKTSILSKQWRHELGLRTDLNFDVHNMFELDCNTIQEYQKNLPLFKGFQSEFATRLNQFMLHYQGAMIRSIRVNFPLGTKHNDVINRMISKGIAKGAERIELLFSYETIDPIRYLDQIEPYKFSFTLLSHTDCLTYLHLQNCHLVAPMDLSHTDCLTYLHLQNCHLVAPMDLSGFKNLRTLVLQLVDVKQDMLHGIFSNCIHLVDFTLDQCDFKSDLIIISSTLFHLNIVNCGYQIGGVRSIDIIASNLSSIEYSFNARYPLHKMNIEAHMLSKFSYRGSRIYSYGGVQFQQYYAFGFSGLKNVTTIVFDGIGDCLQRFVIPLLFSECLQLEDVTFQYCKQMYDMNIISPKLRHLKIIDCENAYSHRINIDALNLSSFEYSGHAMTNIYVNAPSLLKVFWNGAKREKNLSPFGTIARLLQIENLTMMISTSQVNHSKNIFSLLMFYCFYISCQYRIVARSN